MEKIGLKLRFFENISENFFFLNFQVYLWSDSIRKFDFFCSGGEFQKPVRFFFASEKGFFVNSGAEMGILGRALRGQGRDSDKKPFHTRYAVVPRTPARSASVRWMIGRIATVIDDDPNRREILSSVRKHYFF